MKYINKQVGFTAVELLITLFIAAVFLLSGLQLYASIIKTSGETRFQTNANNVIYDYMQRYKSATTNPCTVQTPLTNAPITVAGLSDVTITVVISCPYSLTTSVSKILATILYDDPQQTISNATYINLPGTVTDGLVLNLDAGISTSYPGTGTVWNDLSGNGNNGTLVSGVGYTSANSGALNFDGIDDIVSVPDNNSLDFGINDFSVGFWCFRTVSGYQGGSYVIKGAYTTPGFDTFDGVFRVDTSTGNLATIGLSAAYNVWEYHVFVVNQNTVPYIKHYINGVLNQTGYVEGGYVGTVSNSNAIVIGRSTAGGASRYYNGGIGSVHMYGKSLSADEVTQNFNALRGRYGI